MKTPGLSYQPEPGRWDEALLPSGLPRHHWRKLAVAMRQMGFDQLSRRWQLGQQLIQANGITYNIYGDPQGKERPWQMDPVPLVIDAGEWAWLEEALSQRARLLNAILADLYGPQELLRSRSIPAPLVFGNPQFLRPCHGVKPAGGVYLQNYAADLARSPDGAWWVISDRTQAPSGIGYALENRLVSARTLPSVFNKCQVRPLARFLDTTRDALLAMAPNRRANPSVVLLTPGPNNETFFEHSFLARHWGFPLVEGADLTVRGDRVFLKTLAGLEPVDLILRRLDDSFCDPLELRGDSLLGVPGLVQAVRAGHVAVSNALGSGLTETSTMMAFLPGLSQQVLGEPLKMPSVATWWCGDAGPRKYVLDHLDQIVIKPAFPRPGQIVEFPAYMDQNIRGELVRRIEAQPELYVAQEQVDLSTAPARTDQGLEARHVVLRTFAAWNGESYSVMPGGLTRVSTGARSLVVSMQQGGGSKDTWVLGRKGDSPDLRDHEPAPVLSGKDDHKHSTELPSRVADNLFWLGRYTERLEDVARLIRSLLPGLSGEEDFGRAATLDTGLHLLSGLGYLPAEFQESSLAQQRFNLQRLMSVMIFDSTRTYHLGNNLKQIRRLTWQLKERMSQDTWRVLQQLEADFSRTPPVTEEQRFVAGMNVLDYSMITLSAFAGLLMENTTRGPGWHFLEIGRRLERALQMVELLRVGIVQAPFEIEPYLSTILQIADSSITYRTRYLTVMRTEHVLQLLLSDEGNPRSIAFQLATLVNREENLPRRDESEGPRPEHLLAQAALDEVRRANLDDLAAPDAEGNLTGLDDLLHGLKVSLYDFSEALTARYFSHLAPSRLSF